MRQALRQVRFSPAFFTAAVVTLGLGLGTYAAITSVVHAVLLRPVPAADLDDVWIASIGEAGKRRVGSATRDELRRLESAASGLIVAGRAAVARPVVQVPGQADQLVTEAVSGRYAEVFRLPARAGRWIGPADDSGSSGAVAVISDRIWRLWFAARSDALGSPLTIDGRRHRIVGVAPPAFRGLRPGSLGVVDLWVPIASWPVPERAGFDVRADLFVRPNGRSRPSEAVSAEIAQGLARSTEDATAFRINLAPARKSAEYSAVALRSLSSTAVALAVLTLLAACANLANLLVARGAQRSSEVAVRLALGASRRRIAQLLLAETGLIAAGATVVGTACAYGIVAAAEARLSSFRFRGASVELSLMPDVRAFATALLAGLGAALGVGAVAAWRGCRVPPQQTFASGGQPGAMSRRSRRLRTMLAAVQVAAAFVIVLAAGAFVENEIGSFARFSRDFERVHIDMTHAIGVRVDLGRHGYELPRARRFLALALDEARQLPGVRSAAIADTLPGARLEMMPRQMDLTLDTPDDLRAGSPRRGAARYSAISPGLFDTIGLSILRGRDFGNADTEGTQPVAILSVSAAEALWPGADPLGRTLRYETGAVTVVGIVEDAVTTTETNPYSRPSNHVFVPIAQHPKLAASVVLRAAEPRAQLDALRAALRRVDDQVAVLDAGTLEESAYPHLAPFRASTGLMAMLGIISLGIAVLGVYAVMSYLVTTRTREFGIRAALGATPRRVTRTVLDEAVHMVLVGLLPGVLLAAWSSRAWQTLRAGFAPNSLSTWILVPVIVMTAGLLAAWIPARRAARVDPNVALREL